MRVAAKSGAMIFRHLVSYIVRNPAGLEKINKLRKVTAGITGI